MLKKLVATSLLSSTLVLGGLAPAASAAVVQGGLVNVAIDGPLVVVDDVTIPVQVGANIQVPIGVAANVCNVSVALLATQIAAADDTTCDSRVNQRTEAALDQIQRIAA